MAEIKYSGNNTLAALVAAIKTLFVKKGEAVTSINGATPDSAGNLEVDLKGQRGSNILKVTTSPSSYTNAVNGVTPTHRIALSTVRSQSGAENVLVNDYVLHSHYLYRVCYVDTSYVYLNESVDIRGEKGTDGAHIVSISVSESTATADQTFYTADGSVFHTVDDAMFHVKGGQ